MDTLITGVARLEPIARAADEVFLTAASAHACPVLSIDDAVPADRMPGPVSARCRICMSR